MECEFTAYGVHQPGHGRLHRVPVRLRLRSSARRVQQASFYDVSYSEFVQKQRMPTVQVSCVLCILQFRLTYKIPVSYGSVIPVTCTTHEGCSASQQMHCRPGAGEEDVKGCVGGRGGGCRTAQGARKKVAAKPARLGPGSVSWSSTPGIRRDSLAERCALHLVNRSTCVH